MDEQRKHKGQNHDSDLAIIISGLLANPLVYPKTNELGVVRLAMRILDDSRAQVRARK